MNKLSCIQKKSTDGRFKLLVALTCIAFAQVAYSQLPDDSNFTFSSGSGDYTVSGNEGTLRFDENNSVVDFTGQGFNIGAGSQLNVVPGAAGNSSWVGVARDFSSSASSLQGTLALGMNFYLLNQNGLLLGNNFTLDLNTLATGNSATPGFLGSTYSLDVGDGSFNGASQLLSQSGSSGSIDVEGLAVIGDNGQVLLVSDDINIDGDVSVPEGVFSAAAGQSVLVGLNGGLLFFDIQAELDTARRQRVIDVGRNATVEAGHINLSAWVDDPRSRAVNNRGVLRAEGIGVSEAGTIQLVGNGGIIFSNGTLDTSTTGGDISASAAIVNLRRNVDAGSGNVAVEIGRSGDGTYDAETVGEFIAHTSLRANAASMTVEGFGGRNKIDGLANYVVDGLNSGTAGLAGVGGASHDNIGAITFDNVAWLTGRGNMSHQFHILSSGTLRDDFQGDIDGRIEGRDRNDSFLIEGSVEKLFGNQAADEFVLNGGVVNQLIDGGEELQFEGDVIRNVLNPMDDPVVAKAGMSSGFSGAANEVASWINIEEVTAFIPPTPVPVDPTPVDPTPSIIAPQLSFLNLSQNANAALGLIGADADPKLPCGYGSTIPTEDERAEAEEDCLEDYNSPEYMALMKSIIHFDNDSNDITLASAERLNRVSAFVIDSNIINRVNIAGHTDDNASDHYNLGLSERRAMSASQYMQSRGVDASLIRTSFFGERLPMVPNSSDENRALNRRAVVELER